MHPLIDTHKSALLNILVDALNSYHTLSKRSLLALLGIIIGSASIVAVINIGHNAKHEASKIFQDMGVDTLLVRLSGEDRSQNSPMLTDATTLKNINLPNIKFAPIAIASDATQQNIQLQMIGTERAVFGLMKLSLKQGRFLHEFDWNENVAVLGHEVANPSARPGSKIKVGDWIKFNNYLFKVVGILQPSARSMLVPFSVDNAAFVPLNSIRRVNSHASIDNILVGTGQNENEEHSVQLIHDVLSETFKPRTIDIMVPQQIINGMSRQNRTFHYLLTALGTITLMGGGVAVMNIMYMNVFERRMEIGLRMAVGARRKDIGILFLIEATIMSIVGAVIGAALGMALAYLYAKVSAWEFKIALAAIPLGIVSTVLVGIFFGLKPAITASRMTPVEALRDD